MFPLLASIELMDELNVLHYKIFAGSVDVMSAVVNYSTATPSTVFMINIKTSINKYMYLPICKAF